MKSAFILIALAALSISALVASRSESSQLSASELAERQATEAQRARVVIEGLSLRRIEAGVFEMGAQSNDAAAQPREFPRHQIEIARPFEIARYETTVAQFSEFVEATGYETEAERDPKGGWGFDFEDGSIGPSPQWNWRNPGFSQSPNHPVVQVSWNDAEEFCRWLGAQDGRTYRLPTESEWEYACRAGTETRFSFGDRDEDLQQYANAADQSLRRAMPTVTWEADWDDGAPFTAAVGRMSANPWGLHDMHGNVWEWCADWHRDDGYEPNVVSNRKLFTDAGGVMRAIRGGGWYDGPAKHRSSSRAWFKPVFRYCQLSGFRVVREL